MLPVGVSDVTGLPAGGENRQFDKAILPDLSDSSDNEQKSPQFKDDVAAFSDSSFPAAKRPKVQLSDSDSDSDVCDECSKWIAAPGCTAHPVTLVPNPSKDVQRDSDGRPPLPPGWRYGSHGRGLFNDGTLPVVKGTLLGPLECVTLTNRASMSIRNVPYLWEVRQYSTGANTSLYLLQSHTAAGLRHNWLAAMRFTTVPRLQNAIALQYKGEVYYKLIKQVDVQGEVLACRGQGLPLTKEIPFNKLLCDKKGPCEFLCPDCPAIFRSNERLRAHVAGSRHLEQGPGAVGQHCSSDVAESSADEAAPPAKDCFPCTRCDDVLNTERGLTRHLTVKHKLSQKAFTCSECEKVFKRKHHWQRHQAMHRVHQCAVCGKMCTSESSLALHSETAHGNIVMERKYTCERCSEKFYTYEMLWHHVRMHDSRWRRSLAERMRERRTIEKLEQEKTSPTNNNNAPPEASNDIPKEEPKSESSLQDTQPVQLAPGPDEAPPTTEGRFGCRYCDISYSKPQARSRHERKKHSVEHAQSTQKPSIHRCDTCGKCVSSQHELRAHLKRHDNAYNHRCHLCPCCYVAAADLRKHMRRVHGALGKVDG